jgi:hypothetical protein
VIVHRGRTEATAVRELDASTDTASQVASLFGTFGRLARGASVRVVFDRPIAQLKAIPDAPTQADRRMLEGALRSNADRYFIGGERSFYFGVRVDDDGGAKVVAGNRATIDEVTRAAFAAGAVDLIVFAATSVLQLADDEPGSGFDAAASLAMIDHRTVPAVVICASDVRRRRRLAGGAAAAIAVALLLAMPLVQSRHRATQARNELAAIKVRSDAALEARKGRAALRSMIDRVESPGLAMAQVLADITTALPAGASLLALTIDTAKGSAVIIATNAVESLPALDSVRAIGQLKLSGPVTRERISDRDLERATVLFTVKGQP